MNGRQVQASTSPPTFRESVFSLPGYGLVQMDGRARNTHVEGKLAREVIHAAGVHEAEGVAYSFSAQYALSCDGTDPTIGQGSCHDTA